MTTESKYTGYGYHVGGRKPKCNTAKKNSNNNQSNRSRKKLIQNKVEEKKLSHTR